jgi:energy-coupling factor transporter ATP-binding protein EcfA2
MLSREARTMRIDRLELTNFRCFERATFTFAPGFNVLVGDNGAGKTAVLEALASGLDHALGGLSAHRLGAPKGVFRVARVVAHERDGAVSLEPQFPMALAWQGEVAGQPCRWSDEETDPAVEALGSSVDPSHADVRLTTPDTARVRELVAGLARAVRGGASTTLPVIACYAADRLWTVPTDNRPDTVAPESRLQGYEHWASPDARGGRLAAWFKTQEFIAWQEGREPALLTMAREAIRGCIEGCTDVRYIGRYDALMVRFEAEAWMHFAMLSDGVRSMCALVGDLAYRCAELNPHLGGEATRETPGIVLIDELDLHLHPRWQRRVADDLRRTFPRVQFFATTHSPFIIQSLREGELQELGPLGGHPYVNRSIEDIAEGVMGIAQPQRSERFQRMIDAAKRYYGTLDEIRTHGGDEARASALKSQLDRLMEPFRDDPAYVALLEYRRELSGIDDAPDAANDATG